MDEREMPGKPARGGEPTADLIVVGGGIAGSAVALRAVQYYLHTVWLLGNPSTHKASRAAYVRNIDNMLGVHPDIVRAKVLHLLTPDHPEAARRVEDAHLHISTVDLVHNAKTRIQKEFAEFIRVLPDRAAEASRHGGLFQVRTAGGTLARAPNLVLATGVMDRQPTIHKSKGDRSLAGIHWIFPYANHETLLYCIRCEGHLTAAGRRIGVIGHGNAAAEVALMLRERYGVPVALLTAGEEIRWSEDRGRLLELQSVPVAEGRITDVLGGSRGAALQGFVLEGGETIETDLAFVAMGLHRVYNDLARALGADLEESRRPAERRHVLVDADGETSVPGLFAVGDMSRQRDRPVMKQIYTAQEYAVRAVDAIDRRRRERRRAELLAGGGD
jgi:thioredoxin reductase (NADPH)